MPKLSDKGRKMPASPIRKLVPYAEAAKRRGIEVIHLNIGQPDIHTPKQALEAVRQQQLEVLAYSRSEGPLEFRQKWAAYYQGLGYDIHADQIVITTGGSEALRFTFGSIMDGGDEVIIPEPFYANYNGFAASSNVKIVPVVSTIDTGFALPQIGDFESCISDKTRAILICNPANPTGYLYAREELEKLRDLALKYDLFLIADEVYREFVYEGRQHYSILGFEALHAHAIVVDSMSKRYSMCGARLGCVVSRNATLMDAVTRFAQARLSPPTLALLAGQAALDTPKDYFEAVIAEYDDRRNALVSSLNAIEGVYAPKPSGAFYCVAELPVEDTDNFAQWLLEDFSLDGKTLMLAPASGFYTRPEHGKRQVRIAYVLNGESLREAMRILKAALAQYRA